MREANEMAMPKPHSHAHAHDVKAVASCRASIRKMARDRGGGPFLSALRFGEVVSAEAPIMPRRPAPRKQTLTIVIAARTPPPRR